jgi:hypothetical protein
MIKYLVAFIFCFTIFEQTDYYASILSINNSLIRTISNQCQAFADGCEDYKQIPMGNTVFIRACGQCFIAEELVFKVTYGETSRPSNLQKITCPEHIVKYKGKENEL